MRVAWFSPLPPSQSGIAAYSWEGVGALAARGWSIDLFAPALPDQPCPPGVSAYRAVEFVWRHRRHPYDLPVYQLGNSSAHDFQWGYLFHYPGLLVLHDAQVHQARARLLKETRPTAVNLFWALDRMAAAWPGLLAAGEGPLSTSGSPDSGVVRIPSAPTPSLASVPWNEGRTP